MGMLDVDLPDLNDIQKVNPIHFHLVSSIFDTA